MLENEIIQQKKKEKKDKFFLFMNHAISIFKEMLKTTKLIKTYQIKQLNTNISSS